MGHVMDEGRQYADAGRMPALRGRRILFVVNVDWFFLSHRMPLARAARALGAHVTIAGEDTGAARQIRDEGFAFEPLPLSRSGTQLPAQARALLSLVRLYRRLRPDLVHQVTIKPVLYGSIAARIARVPAVVNAISGLGHLFHPSRHHDPLARLARLLYRLALRGPATRTIFQNPEDRDAFVASGMVAGRQAVLIRGSGVDVRQFVVAPEPPGERIVVLPARMLREKGVGVLAEAARLLRPAFPSARFVLVGGLDPGNPTAVGEDEIRRWVDEGIVEWWGSRSDMPAVFRSASIVALPTHYKEGLPKALLEAAACGRPLVATNIPGCREIVRPGVNGILVPPQDPPALAEALRRLLSDSDERARFGAASRRIAESEFAEEIVVAQTVALYQSLLPQRDR